MKLLYHHRTQGKGAEGVHIISVVRALEAVGYDVDIMSPPGVDPKADAGSYLYSSATRQPGFIRLIWRGLSLHAPQTIFTLAEMAYNLWILPWLLLHIHRRGVEVVYERYAFFLWAGALATRWLNIPFIVEVNEVSGINRSRKQVLVRTARRVESFVFGSADTIVVVSSFLRDTLIARGIDPEKIVIIPNGVDHEKFRPDIPARCEAVANCHSADKVVFGFVGWIDVWDNLPFLIDSFAEVQRRRPQTALVLVGNVVGHGLPGLEILKTDIARRGLENAVFVTGAVPRSEMPQTIAAFDVAVIPDSNPFGSPVVLFEFMASGKPVIAPDLPPLRDVLQHGENGLLFTHKDSGAIQDAMLSLIEAPLTRQRIGSAARQSVLQHHSWEAKVRKILDFHSSRLSQRSQQRISAREQASRCVKDV